MTRWQRAYCRFFFGIATRGCEYASAHDKEYVVRFQLGTSTDTQDITGKVIATKTVTVSLKDVEDVLKTFVGRISQMPPMYSAIKKNGKKLYEYARQGIEVEREARDITIYSAELLDADVNMFQFSARIICSSGTYIRTLCSDLGDKLGCLAVMTDLRRTRSGLFRIEDALSLDQVERLINEEKIAKHVLPLDTIFSEYPKIQVDSYGEARVRNGAFVPLSSAGEAVYSPKDNDARYRVYAPDGAFLMLGRIKPLNTGGQAIFCEKNFFS